VRLNCAKFLDFPRREELTRNIVRCKVLANEFKIDSQFKASRKREEGEPTRMGNVKVQSGIFVFLGECRFSKRTIADWNATGFHVKVMSKKFPECSTTYYKVMAISFEMKPVSPVSLVRGQDSKHGINDSQRFVQVDAPDMNIVLNQFEIQRWVLPGGLPGGHKAELDHILSVTEIHPFILKCLCVATYPFACEGSTAAYPSIPL
jgi:hypothetical protein